MNSLIRPERGSETILTSSKIGPPENLLEGSECSPEVDERSLSTKIMAPEEGFPASQDAQKTPPEINSLPVTERMFAPGDGQRERELLDESHHVSITSDVTAVTQNEEELRTPPDAGERDDSSRWRLLEEDSFQSDVSDTFRDADASSRISTVAFNETDVAPILEPDIGLVATHSCLIPSPIVLRSAASGSRRTDIVCFQGTSKVEDVEDAFRAAGYSSPVIMAAETPGSELETVMYDMWICPFTVNNDCAVIVTVSNTCREVPGNETCTSCKSGLRNSGLSPDVEQKSTEYRLRCILARNSVACAFCSVSKTKCSSAVRVQLTYAIGEQNRSSLEYFKTALKDFDGLYAKEIVSVHVALTDMLKCISSLATTFRESPVRRALDERDPPPGQGGQNFVDDDEIEKVISQSIELSDYLVRLSRMSWEVAYFTQRKLTARLDSEIERLQKSVTFAENVMSGV